ncbi:MAG: hypothetical protein H7289_02395 [Mucilaginibacter sp.]|nr:hypothetical protein [Mucilaginibacter sp.]
MKKILSIACVALVVAAFVSCKKEYITNVTPNQTYITNPAIQPSAWSQTKDGKADSVDIALPSGVQFFSKTDATLVYFSFFSGVYEQIPEVYNGTSYSYFHYVNNNILHLVVYTQPVNGGVPVKPTSAITVKLVLIPSS